MFSLACLSSSRSFVCHLLRYFFVFKVLEPLLGFPIVAAATLLTPCRYHWECF